MREASVICGYLGSAYAYPRRITKTASGAPDGTTVLITGVTDLGLLPSRSLEAFRERVYPLTRNHLNRAERRGGMYVFNGELDEDGQENLLVRYLDGNRRGRGRGRSNWRWGLSQGKPGMRPRSR